MASSSPYRVAPSVSASSGGRLISTNGHALPLAGATLTADAAGGLARVVLEQRFQNVHAEPLSVTYSLPLPSDGAVSGFAFQIGARRVVGEIDLKRAARERFEQAVADGHTAALLEQDRSSLFTQEIGNIPPGEEVIVEVTIDQRLRWLEEGSWEWRFPTVVGPRYMGSPAQTPDAAKITQDVAAGGTGVKVLLSCSIRDLIPQGRVPSSPSHLVRSSPVGGHVHVELRDRAGVAPDRDLVVSWPVATPEVGVSLDVARVSGRPPSEHAHGLLTIVPPVAASRKRAVRRDLIVLLDTSGSMAGDPLAQAVRVTSALIDTLGSDDQLELIEFSNSAHRWRSGPTAATARLRDDALAWLKKLRASGSTDMHAGILEAMSSLRVESQRQVVLITDGMIGFEAQVVAAILEKLPSASRVHTVGVGSSVNRSLTGPAARAGHGVEIIVGLGEDVERGVARILARTDAPLVVDLSMSGSALIASAPARLPDLFAGAPALVSVALRPEGGELRVSGRTADGPFEERVRVSSTSAGTGNQALAALFARERVEDLEMQIAAGEKVGTIDPEIERLGVDFQIATRLTSWVAVSEEATVDPTAPTRRERMPHELPHGMSAAGADLRPAASVPVMRSMPYPQAAAAPYVHAPEKSGYAPPGAAPRARASSIPTPASWSDALELDGAASGGAGPGAPAPGGRYEGPAEKSIAAEDMPAAPKKRGGGIVGAIRDLFKSKDEGVAEPAPASRPVLRARVTSSSGRKLVLEVFADGRGFAWSPGPTVFVTFASGETVFADVEVKRTTRSGKVAAGATARLSLALPSEVASPIVWIAVVLDGVTITIPIE